MQNVKVNFIPTRVTRARLENQLAKALSDGYVELKLPVCVHVPARNLSTDYKYTQRSSHQAQWT